MAEGTAADRKTLEEMKWLYIKGAVTLRDFRIERNGNGRDFDIIPSFAGAYAHGYILRFEIVQLDAGRDAVLLHSSGYYLDGNSKLRIFVGQDEIRTRFPGFVLNRPYTVRATLILDSGHGGKSGQWSDAFIERVFPARARSQSLNRQVRFWRNSRARGITVLNSIRPIRSESCLINGPGLSFFHRSGFFS